MCFRPAAVDAERTCPHCGEKVGSADSVCASCGAELPKGSMAPGAPGVPGAPGIPAAPGAPKVPGAAPPHGPWRWGRAQNEVIFYEKVRICMTFAVVLASKRGWRWVLAIATWANGGSGRSGPCAWLVLSCKAALSRRKRPRKLTGCDRVRGGAGCLDVWGGRDGAGRLGVWGGTCGRVGRSRKGVAGRSRTGRPGGLVCFVTALRRGAGLWYPARGFSHTRTTNEPHA